MKQTKFRAGEHYMQQILANESLSKLERTALASAARHRRTIAHDVHGPAASVQFYRELVDGATEHGLIELSITFGSLTGLVLAAEGVGA